VFFFNIVVIVIVLLTIATPLPVDANFVFIQLYFQHNQKLEKFLSQYCL